MTGRLATRTCQAVPKQLQTRQQMEMFQLECDLIRQQSEKRVWTTRTGNFSLIYNQIKWFYYRAMDTQAPITLGEDEDEQTGNNLKFPPPLGNSVKSSQDENADKPKYKRQEFMRPKYGAVSFDVIDAVNARLAAADSTGQPNGGVGSAQSNEALFR